MPESAYLNKWLKIAVEQTPNLRLHKGSSDKPTLTVTTDTCKNFEIWEYGVRLERLPCISLDEELAIPKLAHVLRHISRYRDIQDIWTRPRASTVGEDDFDLCTANESQRAETIDELERFTIVEGETLPLRFIYKGSLGSVWVQAYELNSSWGIEKKFEAQMFRDVPEPEDFLEISTEIPPKGREDDANETTDRYMIFISDGRDKHSWDEVLLRCLPVGRQPLQLDFGVDILPGFPGGNRGAQWKVKTAPIWGLKVFEIHTLPRGSTVDRK